MSVIDPIQSHYCEGRPVGKRSLLRWKGLVEKVSFESGVKSEGVMDDESEDDDRG